jgi:hypothetical protein
MFKNTSTPLLKETARTTLPKGAALRVILQEENMRYCEIYSYGGWRRLNEDWAKEIVLTYGHKAQRFIQKHIPELLEKKKG